MCQCCMLLCMGNYVKVGHKQRACLTCGDSYTPNGAKQKWCSPACKPPKRRPTNPVPCLNPNCDRTTLNGRNCPRCAARLHRHGAYDLPWREYKVTTSPDGYSRVHVGKDHPMGNSAGLAYVHRLVMSEHIGRPLLKQETVHHKNGDRADNRIKNLELWAKNHGAGQRVDDMIKFAVENYRELVQAELDRTC